MIDISFVNRFGFLFSGALYIFIAPLHVWDVCVVVIFWGSALALFAILTMWSNQILFSSGS